MEALPGPKKKKKKIHVPCFNLEVCLSLRFTAINVLGSLTLKYIWISIGLEDSIRSGMHHLRVELGLESLNHLLPVLMSSKAPSRGAANGMSRVKLHVKGIKCMAARTDGDAD